MAKSGVSHNDMAGLPPGFVADLAVKSGLIV